MTEKLELIYGLQKKFTDRFFAQKYNTNVKAIRNNKQDLVHWTKEYILALIKEATEILDEVDWKSHHNKFDEAVEDNILEEMVDVMKYLFGLAYIYGFSEEEIYNRFVEKSAVVEAKFDQNKLMTKLVNTKNKHLAFIDIDGVLADWPGGFVKFVNSKGYNFLNLQQLKIELPKNIQYDLKRQYRLSGEKRFINKIKDSTEFLDWLHFNGFYIVLLTARPYKKYFRIYSDTLDWLLKNNYKYDAIIWEEEKEKAIIDSFNSHENKFVIEDNIDNAKKLADSGFKVYLKFNKDLYDESYIFSDLVYETKSRKNIKCFKEYNELETIDFLHENNAKGI